MGFDGNGRISRTVVCRLEDTSVVSMRISCWPFQAMMAFCPGS